MRLKRLRIDSFKRFRSPFVIDEFADGLNLFAAPNESGKSTVAEAIRAAFFERHRSGSVEHLRPWGDGSSSPTVEIDFELSGTSFRLTKAFLARKRCELVIDGQAMDGAVAEDHLAHLFGFKFPGKGASTPEHMGIPGLLWVRQGTSHELTDPVAHAADHLRQVLGESLGDVASSQGDALLKSVEASRGELLTPSTGSPRGAYAEALERKEELDSDIARLGADIGAYQTSVDRLSTLRREYQRDEAERPWASSRDQHRAAVARLEAAQGLEARQAAEQNSLRQLGAQVTSLRAQASTFASEDKSVTTRTKALEAAETAANQALSELTSWERRHKDAASAHDTARQTLHRARDATARAGLAKTVADLNEAVGTTRDALAKAREQRTRLNGLRADSAAQAVAPEDLAKLRELTEALRDVKSRLEVVATTLDLELLDGQRVSIGGESVIGASRRVVIGRTEIDVPGVGRVTVTPGGTDLETMSSERGRLDEELKERLAKVGVANIAEAEERSRQNVQRATEANACEALLKAHAPKGLDALESEVETLEARLGEARNMLSALAPAPELQEDAPPLAGAEAASEHARAALETAAASLNDAKVASATAQSVLAAARDELAAAQAVVDDPQRSPRVAGVNQALTDALAQEATARQRVQDVAAELAAVNLALLKQDVERLASSSSQLEQAHARRAAEITRLEVELETKGAMGLEEQRAERQRELDLVARRAEEFRRRAAALDHLLKLLREKRSELARRLRAPLQRHLNHYLQILFPGASIEVGDDLSPGAITRTSVRGDEIGAFEELSVGAREQMGIVARLAYADLLKEAGRPTLLILDDALVHTDEDRLSQMKRVLYDAATRHQVLIFTCHPAAWRDLGVPARSIGP